MVIDLELKFDKGYIAHPFWPEREKVINIQKMSGMNRVRSSQKAEKALREYLAAQNMTMEDYHALVALADRQFYTNGAHIFIPTHHVYGCFANGASVATTSLRVAAPEQIRTVLHTTDWLTDREKPDGIWERFVLVKSGTGATLSNQRALRTNAYIANFVAQAELSFSEDVLRVERVKDFIAFVGREIGIGASRKLGWGRFTIKSWQEA